MKLLVLIALFSGCAMGHQPPDDDECHEFTYHTKRHNKSVTCQMLWCGTGVGANRMGGPTTLWCEEDK